MSNPIKAGNDKMVDEYKAYQSDCEKILSSHYLRSVEFLNTRIFAGGNFFDAQRLLKGTTEDVVTKARLICMAGIPRYEGENIKNEYYNFWCNFIESWENALILRETVSGWFSTKLDQQRVTKTSLLLF